MISPKFKGGDILSPRTTSQFKIRIDDIKDGQYFYTIVEDVIYNFIGEKGSYNFSMEIFYHLVSPSISNNPTLPNQSNLCTCPIQTLMNRGCQCGKK